MKKLIQYSKIKWVTIGKSGIVFWRNYPGITCSIYKLCGFFDATVGDILHDAAISHGKRYGDKNCVK